MKEINDIEKLFSEGFENFEAPVKPELWNSISQGISTTTASSASAGLGVVGKLIVAATVVISGVVSYYVFTNDSKNNVVENTTPPETEFSNENDNVAVLVSPEEVNSISPEPNNIKSQATNSHQRPNDNENLISHFEHEEHINEDVKQGHSKESKEKQSEALQDGNTDGAINNKEGVTEPVGKKTEDKTDKRPDDNKENNVLNEGGVVTDNQAIKNRNKSPEGVFPNGFTPNGDGVNDFLEIEIRDITHFKIEVFTARGELVYYSEDVNFRWDGNHLNGSPVPDGQYVYQIETKDLNGNSLKPIVKLVTISRTIR